MLLLMSVAQAQLSLLNGLFQERAVLQRDTPIVVWGHARAGDLLTVILQGSARASVSARADRSGQWSATLPPTPAGGPFVLEVHDSSGTSQVVNDVLVGDVFLCSGQSNMELPVVRASNSYDEIRNSANSRIRWLNVHQAVSATPLADLSAPVSWQSADPTTVPDWSAVCFFFARELQTTTHVPIGLIQATWGGANIRPWISAEALRTVGGYETGLRTLQTYARDPEAAQEQFAATWQQWWRDQHGSLTHLPADEPWNPRSASNMAAPVRPQRVRPAGARPGGPESGASGSAGLYQWHIAPQGLGDWRSYGPAQLANFTGSVWYRTHVTLSPSQAKAAAAADATLSLGAINQVDQTWLNGRVLGNTFGYETDRVYVVRKGRLRPGANLLVLNITSTYGPGGLLAKGARRALQLSTGESIPLDGVWQYRIVPSEVGYPPRAPWESVGGLSTLYNAMIAPLRSYGLRGVLWYQGESNTSEPKDYRSLLQALTADWRRQFSPDLPFLIVQLPNFGPLTSVPVESGWAEVREAQRLAVAHDSHAGLAVTIDIGDAHNLHPTNKQDVARRLARAARHVIYADPSPPSGPTPVRAVRTADHIAIEWRDVEGGLIAYSHQTPIGFELCGDEVGSCQFALAGIDASRVLLPVPQGARPTQVRYCWADSPICTLADRSGLPAVPFELSVETPAAPAGSSNSRSDPTPPQQ
jgi:sialate O-acetylesterase